MMKSGLLLSVALAALTLAAPARAEEPTAATVIATVNGTDITLGHLIAAREALPEQYKALPDEVLFNGVLEQLIQQTALAQEAEKAPKKLDLLMIENQKRSYLSATVLDAAAASAVTDEALKKLYEEKYVNAEPTKEYDADHILVATEDEAKAIKADLDAGGDFAAIAKEKSQDPGSAANGGDLGWFGLGMMVKPFEDAVVALEKGKISDPVQTDFGWHVIKLNDVRVAEAPKFEDVKPELEGDLRQAAVEARVTELTEGASVVRNSEGIDPTILKKVELLDAAE
ncbi:peptidylprolyl isomerase [Frigidibacter sp. RF13]|uniref:peptidylprolyl isomerase n=1 Tax=Frigidibacter sp. RF13 TaxID=2997340 RepID=UPI00226F4785|nr:peptidylprolyl isomerase [Frigidibacter sp. RF13]MCY1126716.1 peptidylprolyl isomerase [Frigidibacter sp. RF13]